MKADRKRLKGEKTDLVSQMQQLYATLESREEQLRDFIRNYEQHRKVGPRPPHGRQPLRALAPHSRSDRESQNTGAGSRHPVLTRGALERAAPTSPAPGLGAAPGRGTPWSLGKQAWTR